MRRTSLHLQSRVSSTVQGCGRPVPPRLVVELCGYLEHFFRGIIGRESRGYAHELLDLATFRQSLDYFELSRRISSPNRLSQKPRLSASPNSFHVPRQALRRTPASPLLGRGHRQPPFHFRLLAVRSFERAPAREEQETHWAHHYLPRSRRRGPCLVPPVGFLHSARQAALAHVPAPIAGLQEGWAAAQCEGRAWHHKVQKSPCGAASLSTSVTPSMPDRSGGFWLLPVICLSPVHL